MPKDTENSTVEPEIPTASDIRNIIPDDLRLILDNLTGANFLTRTATGEVVIPNGPPRPDLDLIQIANEFDNTVKSEFDADSFQIPEALLRNSLKSEVTNFFPVESLTINDFNGSLGKIKKVFTDETPDQSVFQRIWGASLGALQDKLVDADDADNLIEVEPVDAAQLGGLRAWGGNDLILGTAVDDIVNGNAGSDKILGADGNDLLMGGQDDDSIAGGKGDDLLMGHKGNDELRGGAGNDVIGGGKGTNVLIGNDGNDILIGGGEGDFLIGAEGADHFILRTETLATDAALANRIMDFTPGVDKIKIAHFDGTLAMPQISFADVDVNLDNIQDTAILCLDGGGVNRVVGVILRKDSTPLDLQSSILMVNPKDAALSMIGDIF